MRLDRPQTIKLVVAILFFVLAIIFLVLLNKFNSGVSPANTNEETHASHLSEEASQLNISGIERLEEHGLNKAIVRAVTAQLYAAHYKTNSVLEREAELEDIKRKGKVTTITVKFVPSGKLLSAQITLNNTATNDFDIEILGGNK